MTIHSHKCPACGKYVDPDKGYYSPVGSEGNPCNPNEVGWWELSLYCTDGCQNIHEVRAERQAQRKGAE